MSHTHQEYVVCPHCGRMDNALDFDISARHNAGEDTELECDDCGGGFAVTVHVTCTYSTRKLEADAETSEGSGVFKVEAK